MKKQAAEKRTMGKGWSKKHHRHTKRLIRKTGKFWGHKEKKGSGEWRIMKGGPQNSSGDTSS